MARKTTKKQLEAATKKLTKMDSQTMVSSAQELCQKRDELLQEILEIKIKLAAGEHDGGLNEERMKRCMTEVVLCEKMIGNFGRIDGG